jgi:tetratricopeptide (TPR) repeat protein
VEKEVSTFVALRGVNRVLPVILDGDPVDVVPAALRTNTIVAADFRPSYDGQDIGLLKIVAGILGLDLGELRDRQAAHERARQRWIVAAAAVLTVAAIVATASAFIAVKQTRVATVMAGDASELADVVMGASLDEFERGQTAPGNDHVERAVQIARHMVSNAPDDPEVRHRLATALLLRGNRLTADKHPTEAIPLMQEAIALFQQSPSSARDENELGRLALATLSLGVARQSEGRDLAAARRDFSNALARAQSLLQAYPDSAGARAVVGGAMEHLAEVEPDRKMRTQAFDEAISFRRQSYARDDRPEREIELALTLVAAAMHDDLDMEQSRSDARFTEALGILRRRASAATGELPLQDGLAETLVAYARALKHWGRAADATNARDEAAAIGERRVVSR